MYAKNNNIISLGKSYHNNLQVYHISINAIKTSSIMNYKSYCYQILVFI